MNTFADTTTAPKNIHDLVTINFKDTKDEHGNVIKREYENGVTVWLCYDENNNISSYRDHEGCEVKYDTNGNKTSISDIHGARYYTYDLRNNKTSFTSKGKTCYWTYDETKCTTFTDFDGVVTNY